MDLESIMNFVKRTNPDVTEKQIVDVSLGYTGYALTLISNNIKNAPHRETFDMDKSMQL